MKELIEFAIIKNEEAGTVEQLEKQQNIITSLLQSIQYSVAKLSDNASDNAGMALSDEFIEEVLKNVADYNSSDFGQDAYKKFRSSINVVLHDYLVKAELQKRQYRDVLFAIVTAVAYVFRAFFRLFDVLIASVKAMTGEKYQTKNQTPGYKPFISYPSDETPSSKRIAELYKDVDQAIKELDNVVLHIESPAP